MRTSHSRLGPPAPSGQMARKTRPCVFSGILTHRNLGGSARAGRFRCTWRLSSRDFDKKTHDKGRKLGHGWPGGSKTGSKRKWPAASTVAGTNTTRGRAGAGAVGPGSNPRASWRPEQRPRRGEGVATATGQLGRPQAVGARVPEEGVGGEGAEGVHQEDGVEAGAHGGPLADTIPAGAPPKLVLHRLLRRVAVRALSRDIPPVGGSGGSDGIANHGRSGRRPAGAGAPPPSAAWSARPAPAQSIPLAAVANGARRAATAAAATASQRALSHSRVASSPRGLPGGRLPKQ